jgi:uncharacterized protein
MANTANTQEPTMEEILASIRRIISEDTEEAKPAEAPKPKAAAPAAPAAKPAPKAAPEPEPEPEEDVLELTEVVPEEDTEEEAGDSDVVMVERAPAKAAPRPAPIAAPRARQDDDDGLLTDAVRNQASSSFLQLTRGTLVSETSPADPRSIEALVQDMLRPALEEWLNLHLPGIVERLVQQEIDRVSRKAGG